jgi:hypothetical protein
MYEPLNDPASIEAVNQFFNDLIAVADFEAQLLARVRKTQTPGRPRAISYLPHLSRWVRSA